MNNSFYSIEELHKLNFSYLGDNVLISRKCSIYNPEKVSIGSHVRIDDFAIITAAEPVILGNYTHISAHASIFGAAGVVCGDYVTISGRVAIYSESDDYSGESATNPMLPMELKPKYKCGKIKLESFAIIGTNSTLMPGITLKEGCAIGAHSYVTGDCEPWSVYAGVPAKKIKRRSSNVKGLVEAHLREH